MPVQDIQIIDPYCDALIQHLAIKDPKLYAALTNKKTISLDLSSLFENVIVHSLKTADEGQRVEIDGTNGIRIYDSLNNLNVQLNGSALTIKTAATGDRIELDVTNGLRVFNNLGVVQSAFKGAAVTLPNSVIATQHLIDDAVTNLKIADDAVQSAQVQDLAIIAGKLATNSVITANLTAGAVTAIKINVSQLSAISADIGNITAGTVTGVVFKTTTSGQRVEIDGANGIRIYDSTNTLYAQLNGTTLSFAPGFVNGNAITNGTIVAAQLSVSTLDAISANLGAITAGTLSAVDITGGTITGTLIQTAGSGARISLDSTNGMQVIDGSSFVTTQILPSAFEGIRTSFIHAIANSIRIAAFDDSSYVQIDDSGGGVNFFTTSGGNNGSGLFDANGWQTGAGNKPTALAIYGLGALRRINVQQGVGPGSGYLYLG